MHNEIKENAEEIKIDASTAKSAFFDVRTKTPGEIVKKPTKEKLVNDDLRHKRTKSPQNSQALSAVLPQVKDLHKCPGTPVSRKKGRSAKKPKNSEMPPAFLV